MHGQRFPISKHDIFTLKKSSEVPDDQFWQKVKEIWLDVEEESALPGALLRAGHVQ